MPIGFTKQQARKYDEQVFFAKLRPKRQEQEHLQEHERNGKKAIEHEKERIAKIWDSRRVKSIRNNERKGSEKKHYEVTFRAGAGPASGLQVVARDDAAFAIKTKRDECSVSGVKERGNKQTETRDEEIKVFKWVNELHVMNNNIGVVLIIDI